MTSNYASGVGGAGESRGQTNKFAGLAMMASFRRLASPIHAFMHFELGSSSRARQDLRISRVAEVGALHVLHVSRSTNSI